MYLRKMLIKITRYKKMYIVLYVVGEMHKIKEHNHSEFKGKPNLLRHNNEGIDCQKNIFFALVAVTLHNVTLYE